MGRIPVTHPQETEYLFHAIQAQIDTSPVDAGDVLTMLAYIVGAVLCGPQVLRDQRLLYWSAFVDIVDTLLFEQKLDEGEVS